MQSFNRRSTPAAQPGYFAGNVAPQPAQNGQFMGNANSAPPLQMPQQPAPSQGPTQQNSHHSQQPPQQQPPPQPQKKLSPYKAKRQQQLYNAVREEHINTQIARIDGKNKVLDFSDGLVRADPKDYANIHGTGGHEHAPNSVIRVALTDYTNKGNSVYVTVNLDVYRVFELLSAVDAAARGNLGVASQMPVFADVATAHGMVLGWLQAGCVPPHQGLVAVEQLLAKSLTALNPETPTWALPPILKTNPYTATKGANGKKLTKVSSLNVQYFPNQNYQWHIRVTNFLAPLNEYESGAITFSGNGAIDKKEAIIFVTTSDLLEALNHVADYIAQWTDKTDGGTIATMHDEKESRREVRSQEQRPQR